MTSTIARYDIHRAAAEGFEPADYRFVGAIDTDTSPFRADDRQGRKAIAALVAEGFEYAEVHPYGQCDHCGQHLRYVAVMLHVPSDGLIQVGLTCLGNRFAATKAEIDRMMAEAKAAREAHKLLDGFLADCVAYPALAYVTYFPNILAAAPADTFSDFQIEMLFKIVRQARQYGSLAKWHVDRVEQLIGELEINLNRQLDRLAEQEHREAARAAAKAQAGPAPEGRVTIEGEVVNVVEKLGDWGTRIVITVRLDNGAIVEGTAPAAIAEAVENGLRVAFTARFEAPKGQAGWVDAFFSRPTKASIIR